MESSSSLYILSTEAVAGRLAVSVSTLNSWLRDDAARPEARRRFSFHRQRGRARFWSQDSFLKLEEAIHRESQTGVLSPRRVRNSTEPDDPDAEAALNQVLGNFLHNRAL